MEHGYWGLSTSTVDFCEPNYVYSRYVAEFFNTLSSIPIFLSGVIGIYHCKREELGLEFSICYGMLAVIGMGSVAFHATLLREGQVLDEIPMLWGALMFTYALIQAQDFRLRRSLSEKRIGMKKQECSMHLVRLSLAVCGFVATVVYFSFGFVIFILIYIFCVATLVILAAKATFCGKVATPVRTRRLMITAAVVYTMGFLALWVPGEVFCRHLPVMERLSMHAIFHLSSTAGPHLLLTAMALVKHQAEKPRSSCSLMFMGLPAAQRRIRKRRTLREA